MKIEKLLKFGGLCGILMPIVAISSILLATNNASWFRWDYHCLSNLGVDGTPAIIFNTGIIISGVLAVIFGIFLINVLPKSILSIIGSFIFILSAILLTGIGIFPETTGDLHMITSFGFYILVAFAILIIGIAIIKSSIPLAIFMILMAFVIPLTFFVPWPKVSCAIAEVIAFIPLIIFSIIFGIFMICCNTYISNIGTK
jgi:hypothetical membrane protein